jgi:hypothetical protein
VGKRTEHEEIAARNSLGREATFSDTEIQGQVARLANELLRELGENLGQQDPALARAKYLGSAAVHIYQYEGLGSYGMSIQTETLAGVPELTASAAFTELQNKMMTHYGRKERRKFKAGK